MLTSFASKLLKHKITLPALHKVLFMLPCSYLGWVWTSEAAHPGQWRGQWGWWTAQLGAAESAPTAGSGAERCPSGRHSTGSPHRPGAAGGPPENRKPRTPAGPILRGRGGRWSSATPSQQPWWSWVKASIIRRQQTPSISTPAGRAEGWLTGGKTPRTWQHRRVQVSSVTGNFYSLNVC